MYGLVNKGIEDLIRREFGDESWLRICSASGLELDSFSSMKPYPDGVTYAVVAAASTELKMTVAEVLERFGAHWVLYTGQQGYGDLFKMAGRTVEEVLVNLNSLHGRVEHTFPEFVLPEFACARRPDGTLLLTYRSSREGLAPMVIGMVRGLGVHFGTPVEISHTMVRAAGHTHDEFVLRVTAS